MKKVLNLYAGIGGNRKLWEDVEVTAIELNQEIAKIYQDFFPDDEVIVTDAHQYLLEHYDDEWDFIWSSPPCPTHSKLVMLNHNMRQKPKYPDMELYQEIILMQFFSMCPWVIENVQGYYEPLIIAYESGRHYFWSNFHITNIQTKHTPIKNIRGLTASVRKDQSMFDIKNYYNYKGDKRTLFKNCVDPKLGKHIFDCAFRFQQQKIMEASR